MLEPRDFCRCSLSETLSDVESSCTTLSYSKIKRWLFQPSCPKSHSGILHTGGYWKIWWLYMLNPLVLFQCKSQCWQFLRFGYPSRMSHDLYHCQVPFRRKLHVSIVKWLWVLWQGTKLRKRPATHYCLGESSSRNSKFWRIPSLICVTASL